MVVVIVLLCLVKGLAIATLMMLLYSRHIELSVDVIWAALSHGKGGKGKQKTTPTTVTPLLINQLVTMATRPYDALTGELVALTSLSSVSSPWLLVSYLTHWELPLVSAEYPWQWDTYWQACKGVPLPLQASWWHWQAFLVSSCHGYEVDDEPVSWYG